VKTRIFETIEKLQRQKKVPLRMKFRIYPVTDLLKFQGKIIITSFGDLKEKYGEKVAALSIGVAVKNIQREFEREKFPVLVLLDHKLTDLGGDYLTEYNQKLKTRDLKSTFTKVNIEGEGKDNDYEYAEFIQDCFNDVDVYEKYMNKLPNVNALKEPKWGPIDFIELDDSRRVLRNLGYRTMPVIFKNQIYLVEED
jgi:hypothetical protein